jgi:hypothetical protein
MKVNLPLRRKYGGIPPHRRPRRQTLVGSQAEQA